MADAVCAQEARFSVAGKTAVVTGGHRGIGREITLALARAGADVYVIDRNGANDSDIPAQLKTLGRKYHSVRADLRDPEAITRAAGEIISMAGTVDILVNNAGVSKLGRLEDLSASDWDVCMELNARAPLLLSQEFVKGERGMLQRGKGVIVNVSSLSGMHALDMHGAYCPSKAAVNMLTQMMTLEWAGRGIRANAVAPTVVLTEMGQKVWGNAEKGSAMMAKIPQNRFAEPHEVSDAVLFLCSEASSMINGAIVPIDGGYGCQ